MSHLRAETGLLADALDTEVTRAALAFEIPLAPAASYEELERTWAAWNRDARWPRIVSGVSLLEPAGGDWRVGSLGHPATFDIRSVLRVGPSAEHRTLSLRTNRGAGGLNDAVIVDNHPAFLRPISAVSTTRGEPRMSWLLIRFNESELIETVLPRLLETHSSAEDRTEFQFEIKRERAKTDSRDIVATDLFHYRPDCLTTRAGNVVE